MKYIENSVHEEFSKLAQKLRDEQQIRVDQVAFEWQDVTPNLTRRFIVREIRVATTTSD